jgi:predicted transcriptional regulator
MIEKTIQVFTEKEEEFVELLVKIGTQKTIAKTLVYLAGLKKATSREIERGADLRQPEVSVAMKYLAGKGWVKSRQVNPEKKGRPIKVWNLNVPVEKILDAISREKQDELKSRLEMIRKVRNFA